MKEINVDKLIHLPGESRYGADCTLVVAHLWPVHVPDGTGISHIPVGHVATTNYSASLRAVQGCTSVASTWSAGATLDLHHNKRTRPPWTE